MNTLQRLMLVGCVFLLSGCSNIRIGFDEFPDGTAVPAWNGTGISQFVISTQYAPDGVVRFDSDINGVLPLVDSNTSSPPNMVCPRNAGGTFNADTEIELAQSTCNIWINLQGPSQVTVTAYDINNNPISSTVGVLGKVRVNVCGIRRVRLVGAGNYCFDDFTWQKR